MDVPSPMTTALSVGSNTMRSALRVIEKHLQKESIVSIAARDCIIRVEADKE